MNDLRQEVKLIKAIYDVPYKEMAECIEIKESSFYNWLHYQYELSKEKELELTTAINRYKE